MHTAASNTPPPTMPNADQTVDMVAVPSIIFCRAYAVARSENAVNTDCNRPNTSAIIMCLRCFPANFINFNRYLNIV